MYLQGRMYRSICPQCATRLSRLRYFSTVALYWTCRNCGAQFRFNTRGLLVAAVFLAIAAAFYYLRFIGAVPLLIVRGLFVVLLGLVIWLMPLLTPMKLKPRKDVPHANQ